MAELIVEPIQTAELESSGYIGQPEGNIDLTENNVQVNVAPYKYATPKIPIQEDVPAVNPSTQEQIIEPAEGFAGLKKITVNPANLESKRVTPTTEEQTITPQSPAIGFDRVIVGAAPQPTLIIKQITANGTYSAEDDNADGYSEVTVDVEAPTPLEEKAVNFYDYDGTVLYAYTAQEALALTELPTAPVHEGLVFQEWNWSLSDLKDYVRDYGAGQAGANYTTSDGKTRIYLDIDDYVSLNDWDINIAISNGTVKALVDGQQIGSASNNSSPYEKKTISCSIPRHGLVRLDLEFIGDGGFKLGNENKIGYIFSINSQRMTVTKIEIGNYVTELSERAFQDCRNLEYISVSKDVSLVANGDKYFGSFYYCLSLQSLVIPYGNTDIKVRTFYYDGALKTIIFPKSIQSFGTGHTFRNCYALSKIMIPPLVKSIPEYMFNSCTTATEIVIPKGFESIGYRSFAICSCLERIIIPNSVTNIYSRAFENDDQLYIIDLSAFTDPNNLPALENADALLSNPTTQIIYIANQEMLDTFAVATNWSAYADRFQIKPSGV